MKIQINKKQNISKRIKNTFELITLIGILCSIFLIMYVVKANQEQPSNKNEDLVYVFKETELYDILDFDQIEEVNGEEKG
jgi:hypothetical protein